MRNSLHMMALLCLSFIGQQGLDVVKGINTAAEEKQMNQMMVEMLAESELDLKAFMYIKHGKSGDKSEEYVQEDDEEEDDDEEEESPHHPDSSQLIGRDKDGKFRNHENYLQLKNRINEQEAHHKRMFDAINERLTDDTFTQQSIKMRGADDDAADKGDEKAADKEKAAGGKEAEAASKSSSSPDGMTEADVKCYEKRFSDLGK